jgi:hypothetical protein
MPSSGILCRVAVLRTDVSEDLIAFIIRVTRIGELRTTLAVTDNQSTLRRRNQLLATANVVPNLLILLALMTEAICSSESSVLNKSHTA